MANSPTYGVRFWRKDAVVLLAGGFNEDLRYVRKRDPDVAMMWRFLGAGRAP
ncbi:MAG: hypothetical protein K8T90_04610 [Planctomycetes bacterium]|nr:hypothetical protein [Planctomycetota bacterium]